MHPRLAGLQSEWTWDWGKNTFFLGASTSNTMPLWGVGVHVTQRSTPSCRRLFQGWGEWNGGNMAFAWGQLHCELQL